MVAENRAVLAGLLTCPNCAAPMYGIRTGEGNQHLYYRCAGSGAQRKGCGNMCRLAETDAAVDRIASEMFDSPVMTGQTR